MKTQATAKFIPTSTRKAGLVAALIRDRQVGEARTILRYTPKRATEPVSKVLNSAIANATEKGAKERELVVASVLVGPGPTQKRFRAGSRGRADAQLHRTCHITVVVSDETKLPSAKPKSAKIAAQAKATNIPEEAK